jgi:hypothetical protein
MIAGSIRPEHIHVRIPSQGGRYTFPAISSIIVGHEVNDAGFGR